MADVNPKHKPLHRVRQIRDAKRSASLFPKLAKDLFTPTYAINHPFNLDKEPWADQKEFMESVIPPKTMLPQPTMNEFYQDLDVDLEPTFADFDDEEANEYTIENYSLDGHPPGFVGVITDGFEQGDRISRAGLDPGLNLEPEELCRVAELEAAIQRERNKITMQTIIKESSKRKKRQHEEAFPGLKHNFKPLKK